MGLIQRFFVRSYNLDRIFSNIGVVMRKISKRSMGISLLKIATMTLVLVFFMGASETVKAIDTGNLKMYCWSGAGTGSYLDNKIFDNFFKNAVKIKQTKIDSNPSKQIILNEIKDADVIYANIHVTETTASLVTGTGDGPEDRITIPEIEDLYRNAPHLPTLVIIDGCKSIRDSPGFQITDETNGRAFIGLNENVAGACGDAFFRIFFALWTKTPDITLDKAKEETIAFFKGPLPEGQEFLANEPLLSILPGCPPEKIGDLASIVGDKTLTFNRLVASVR